LMFGMGHCNRVAARTFVCVAGVKAQADAALGLDGEAGDDVGVKVKACEFVAGLVLDGAGAHAGVSWQGLP
jgi:hypothetical protein